MTESTVVEKKQDAEGACGSEEDLSGLLFPGNPELEEILQRQEALNGQLMEIDFRVEQVQEKLAHLTEMQQTLEIANTELSRMGDLHWQQHIIAPMAQQIFPIFDFAIGLRAAHRARGGKELEALKAIHNLLQDFLETYGISVIYPLPGQVFDSSLMQAVKVFPTEDETLDKCVRTCVQVGFQWTGGATIRPASIYLWRRQPAEGAVLSIHQSPK